MRFLWCLPADWSTPSPAMETVCSGDVALPAPYLNINPVKWSARYKNVINRQIMNVCTVVYGMSIVSRNLRFRGSSWKYRDSWGFKDRPYSSVVARLEGLVLRWLGQQLTKTRTDVLWPKPMECQWHNLTSLEESIPICSCWLQPQNATGSHRRWGLQSQRQRGF